MATILGARLLLLVVILDCFLYFGMTAVSSQLAPSFGGQVGKFVNINGAPNDTNNFNQVNVSSGGQVVQASSLGYTNFGISNIINFIGTIFSVMTAPMTMVGILCNGACTGGMLFIQVLVGGSYIVLVLASVAQLISGRFA